ncbi:unnamed protein product [Allacma fusca]|uniref:Galectin domain-containing protein n=1 Tax=Allacma fusca TaxID=39272 RepID=A0A8J2JP42_9HEXA|nr:unnamed protein product [Allacma fusca]
MPVAPIYNPQVPFTTVIDGGFGPGTKVRIQGRVPLSSTSFLINFQAGDSSNFDDIPFQFSPRFNENVIVRRAKVNGKWGNDEKLTSVKGHFPFQKGQPFVVMITADPKLFQLMVNGRQFATFHHKTSPSTITHLSIQGQVSISLILFGLVESVSTTVQVSKPSVSHVPVNRPETRSNTSETGSFNMLPQTVTSRDSINSHSLREPVTTPTQHAITSLPQNYNISSLSPSYDPTTFPSDPRTSKINSRSTNASLQSYILGNGAQLNPINLAIQIGATEFPAQTGSRQSEFQNDTRSFRQSHPFQPPPAFRPFQPPSHSRPHPLHDSLSDQCNNAPRVFLPSNAARYLRPTEMRPFLPLPGGRLLPSPSAITAPAFGTSNFAAQSVPSHPYNSNINVTPRPSQELGAYSGNPTRTTHLKTNQYFTTTAFPENPKPSVTLSPNNVSPKATLQKKENTPPSMSTEAKCRPKDNPRNSLLKPNYLTNQLMHQSSDSREVSKKIAQKIRKMQKRESQRVERISKFAPIRNYSSLPLTFARNNEQICEEDTLQAKEAKNTTAVPIEIDEEESCIQISDSPTKTFEREDIKVKVEEDCIQIPDSPTETTEREDVITNEEVEETEVLPAVAESSTPAVGLDVGNKSRNIKRPRESHRDEDPDLQVVVTYTGNLQESITDEGFNAFCSALDSMICHSIRGPDRKAYRILASTLTEIGRITINCLDQATVSWVIKASSTITWNSPIETKQFKGWLSSEIPTIPKITYRTFKVWVPGVKPNLTEFFEVLQGLNDGLSTSLWRCYNSTNGNRDKTSSSAQGFELILGIDLNALKCLQERQFSLFYGSNPLLFNEKYFSKVTLSFGKLNIPYSGFIHGGFGPGRSVRIQGRTSPSASHFTVNLQCGGSSHDDFALHFNPRFNENAIIRNARSYSSWGQEERHGGIPLMRGQHFELVILSEAQRFMIAINGQHFTEFTHRVPSDRVNHLSIEGEVSVSLIQFEGTAGPSGYNPSAPIIGASAAYPASNAPYPASNAPYPPMGLVTPGGHSPYPPAGPAYSPAAPGYPSAGGPGYPHGAGGYPPAGVPGYPSGPPPPAYGSPYPQTPAYPQSGYPPSQSAYPTQPGYAAPGQGPYQGAYPQGGYPPQHGYPDQHKKSGGLLDNAGKMIGAGLVGVGLGSVANKIGVGGHGHGHGMGMGQGMGHGMGHGPGHGGGGGLGGILGPAAALGVGGLVAGKAAKKGKKNKLLKNEARTQGFRSPRPPRSLLQLVFQLERQRLRSISLDTRSELIPPVYECVP